MCDHDDSFLFSPSLPHLCTFQPGFAPEGLGELGATAILCWCASRQLYHNEILLAWLQRVEVVYREIPNGIGTPLWLKAGMRAPGCDGRRTIAYTR